VASSSDRGLCAQTPLARSSLRRIAPWSAALIALGAFGSTVVPADPPDLSLRRSARTGRVYFVTATGGGAIPVDAAGGARVRPDDFLRQYGHHFGIDDAGKQIRLTSSVTDGVGRVCTTFSQHVKSVPVFSGVIKVHQDAAGEVVAANGHFQPVPGSTGTVPLLDLVTAVALAAKSYESWEPTPEHGELVIVDPGWYGDPPAGAHLAYYLILHDMDAGLRQGFFVDAHSGKVLDRWDLIHTARVRDVYDGLGGSGLPGVLARAEGDPPVVPPSPEDVNRAYDYAGDVYDFFDRGFGRDSIDGAGMTMVLTVNSTRPPCPNAFWNGVQMVFCDGTVTDDVTAHEIMHGVTQHTADLIYQNQPGQLNEAYSDIFGEMTDLLNGDAAFAGPPGGVPSWPAHPTGPGLDTPNNLRSTCTLSPSHTDGVRWLMGEDATAFGGAIRDMWDPTCMGDPDRASSPLQTCPSSDSGGVHSGSGIANHAFAILSDGKTFNGHAVSGIGTIKAAAVWYRALTTYLSPASDFEDAYAALNQAALDLVGATITDPRDGSAFAVFTAADAAEVDESLLAVEMDTPGACGQTVSVLIPDTPVRCANRTLIYADDFENGTNGWTVSHAGPAGPPTPYDWEQTTDLPLGRSGTAWFGADPGIGNCSTVDESAVHSLFSPAIVLPAETEVPVLDFTHLLATEGGWDGGNVKIRVNGGPWQAVPGTAFRFNPYNAVLNASAGSGNTNPLQGQEGWTGPGGGWGTSVVDLSGLATTGDTVQLRFDFGKDGCTGVDGWYLHELELYSCPDCNGNGALDQAELYVAVYSGPLGDIGQGSPREFSFAAPLAVSDVVLSFVASADLQSIAEFIDVDVNGTPVGRVFESGALDCPTAFAASPPDRAELVVPAATFNAALVGGQAEINLVATSEVTATLCDGRSFVAVFVEYATDAADCNVNLVPDDCEPDCQPNGVADECDIAGGTSPDSDGNAIPDECEAVIPPPGAPLAAPYPHERKKNRYVSFDPNKGSNDGRNIAFQVVLDGLMLGSCNGNGAACRLDRGEEDCMLCSGTSQPCLGVSDCQPAGQSCDPSGESCVNDLSNSVGLTMWVGAESPAANGSHLVVTEPNRQVSADWPAIVHVGDCEIVPLASYHVVAVDVDADLTSEPLAVQTIERPDGNAAWWADGVGALEAHCEGDLREPACDPLVGDCPPGQACDLVWGEPDGAANFDDILAAVTRFAALPESTLPEITWVDMHGNDSGAPGSEAFDPPNGVANFADVQFMVLAFQGRPYPFFDPADCPDTSAWP